MSVLCVIDSQYRSCSCRPSHNSLLYPRIHTRSAKIVSKNEQFLVEFTHTQGHSCCKMGCFSSKLEAESDHSFKQELRKSLQRRVAYFPALEDIFLPLNGDDHQFLTANTVIKKLLVRSNSTESQPPESTTEPEIINVRELMAGLDEEDEELEVMIQPGEEEEEEEEKRLICNQTFPLRSKSFDAVKECEEKVTDEKLNFQKLVRSNPKDGMCNETKKKTRRRQLGTLSATIDLGVKKSLIGYDDEEEEYITPKFGSFRAGGGGHCVGRDDGCKDGAVFDPELLAAIEAAMEKMRADEEIVIQQMKDL